MQGIKGGTTWRLWQLWGIVTVSKSRKGTILIISNSQSGGGLNRGKESVPGSGSTGRTRDTSIIRRTRRPTWWDMTRGTEVRRCSTSIRHKIYFPIWGRPWYPWWWCLWEAWYHSMRRVFNLAVMWGAKNSITVCLGPQVLMLHLISSLSIINAQEGILQARHLQEALLTITTSITLSTIGMSSHISFRWANLKESPNTLNSQD